MTKAKQSKLIGFLHMLFEDAEERIFTTEILDWAKGIKSTGLVREAIAIIEKRLQSMRGEDRISFMTRENLKGVLRVIHPEEYM